MHILLTVLHTFLMELVRRICLRQLSLGDHFLYSHHWNVWTSNDNVKRNFIFVTVRAERVNRYMDIDYTEGMGVMLARVYNIRSLLPTTSIRFSFKIWNLFQVSGIAARSPLFIRKSTHLMSCISDETLILLETQLLSFWWIFFHALMNKRPIFWLVFLFKRTIPEDFFFKFISTRRVILNYCRCNGYRQQEVWKMSYPTPLSVLFVLNLSFQWFMRYLISIG